MLVSLNPGATPKSDEVNAYSDNVAVCYGIGYSYRWSMLRSYEIEKMVIFHIHSISTCYELMLGAPVISTESHPLVIIQLGLSALSLQLPEDSN